MLKNYNFPKLKKIFFFFFISVYKIYRREEWDASEQRSSMTKFSRIIDWALIGHTTTPLCGDLVKSLICLINNEIKNKLCYRTLAKVELDPYKLIALVEVTVIFHTTYSSVVMVKYNRVKINKIVFDTFIIRRICF